jgi:hypothetical protein
VCWSEEERTFFLVPVGEWTGNADRRFLQLGQAHILPAEGAAPGHPEAVDGFLAVVEFN